MANVSQKYLKDADGNIFSPIVSVDSIYNGGGETLEVIINNLIDKKIKDLENRKQNKEWKSQIVNLGFTESIIIEDIKNANEVQLYTQGSTNIQLALYFTRADSGRWLQNCFVEWNTNTNHHACCTVDFSNGYIQNGNGGDTSTTIKQISWR